MAAMEDDVRELVTAENGTASLLSNAEINQQIATAHRYPRSIRRFLDEGRQLVTLTAEVADDCIYALPRDGKTIEGPSARFAEIIAHSWGNARAGARTVDDSGEFVTAQGVFHDLEKNVAITYEVKRRIVDKHGRRFKPDMIGVTSNAACSIALRNAVLKGVPKAFWSPLYEDARRVVMGDAKTLVNRRADALNFLQKFGATEAMVLGLLGVAGVEDITLDHLVTLRGIATAIKEGDTTVEQAFTVKDDEPAPTLKQTIKKKGPAPVAEAKPEKDATTLNEEAKPEVASEQQDAAPIEAQSADAAVASTEPRMGSTEETTHLLQCIADATTFEELDYVRSRNAERDAPPNAKTTVTRSIDARTKWLAEPPDAE